MRLMLLQELFYYFKNLKEIIVISSLFLTITLAARFAFPGGEAMPPVVAQIVLWLATLVSAQAGAAASWQRHADSGELELLPLLPWSMEWTVLAKTGALLLVLWAQLAVMVPVSALWLQIPWDDWGRLWLGLGCGAVGFVCLYHMAAAFLAGQRKSAAVLGLIALPLVIPVLIFGMAYVGQPELWHEHLGFLVGYALLLVPMHALAAAASLRHGH